MEQRVKSPMKKRALAKRVIWVEPKVLTIGTMIVENALIAVDGNISLKEEMSLIRNDKAVVYDCNGDPLKLFDLVEIKELDDSSFEIFDDDELTFVKQIVGRYGRLQFWGKPDDDPRWYYQSCDQCSIYVRHFGNDLGLIEAPVSVRPINLRRLIPNAVLSFPYSLPMVSKAFNEEPAYKLCRKLLEIPLAQLENPSRAAEIFERLWNDVR